MPTDQTGPEARTHYGIDIRVRLALLWTTLMFLYIYADYFRLMSPGKLQSMMELRTPVGPTSPGLLVVFSVMLMVPALMISLCVLVRPHINRWLNIMAAFPYAIISMLIIASSFGDEWQTFFVIFNCVELSVLAAIIWLAWRWPREAYS